MSYHIMLNQAFLLPPLANRDWRLPINHFLVLLLSCLYIVNSLSCLIVLHYMFNHCFREFSSVKGPDIVKQAKAFFCVVNQ